MLGSDDDEAGTAAGKARAVEDEGSKEEEETRLSNESVSHGLRLPDAVAG